MAPHSTDPRFSANKEEEVENHVVDYMNQLIYKAAHLTREQELFLMELDAFKVRLERVEGHLTAFKRRK